MPLVRTADLVADARNRSVGVAAFNIITLEHAEGVVAAAERVGVQVIAQISENAVRYHAGDPAPLAAAVAALARRSPAEVALHLDHVEDLDLLHRSAEAGFGSVMVDASTLDYADNVATTRAATEWAHARGLFVEAELGAIGGKGGPHTPGVRTDPADAAAFAQATGVDALAVAVGSSHAMTEPTAELDLQLISALRDAVAVPLVLHGSSGVADDHLREAIAAGIVKVNIGTIVNVAFTRGARSVLDTQPDVVDPRRYLAPARDAVADEVVRLLTVVTSPTNRPGS